MEAGQAGNAVQLIVFFGICVGYISTYIFRVANKVIQHPATLACFSPMRRPVDPHKVGPVCKSALLELASVHQEMAQS